MDETRYVAKKAGMAGMVAAEFLEICVQYPTVASFSVDFIMGKLGNRCSD